MKKIALTLLTCSLLTACTAGAYVTADGAGSVVLNDTRNMQTVVSDENTSRKISRKINTDTDFDNSHVVVATFDQVVLLVGQTPQASLKVRAGQNARTIADTRKVYNEIQISTPTALLVRSNDTWLTTKVKTQMLRQDELHSGMIKVLTENSTVYLMGQVSPSQAELAVEVARRVKGVTRVVKAFEMLPEN